MTQKTDWTKDNKNGIWHNLAKSYSGATLKTVILLSPGVDERGNRVLKGTAEEDKGICSSLEECRSNGCFHSDLDGISRLEEKGRKHHPDCLRMFLPPECTRKWQRNLNTKYRAHSFSNKKKTPESLVCKFTVIPPTKRPMRPCREAREHVRLELQWWQSADLSYIA